MVRGWPTCGMQGFAFRGAQKSWSCNCRQAGDRAAPISERLLQESRVVFIRRYRKSGIYRFCVGSLKCHEFRFHIHCVQRNSQRNINHTDLSYFVEVDVFKYILNMFVWILAECLWNDTDTSWSRNISVIQLQISSIRKCSCTNPFSVFLTPTAEHITGKSSWYVSEWVAHEVSRCR